MPCYKPVTAYRSNNLTITGKRTIVFDKSKSSSGTKLQLPCGQCYGCRLEYSRQWAVRCLHESHGYDENCFITLTYNDENLPWDHSLIVDHFQDFMKRFRKEISPKKIRYFHSGEYGQPTPENNFIARPHYHALIFNYQFSDRDLWTSKEGINLYTSNHLDALWTHGHTSVGDLTFESAAYVARYILKKTNASSRSPDDFYLKYARSDHITGEIHELKKEYSTMSRRPGIGKDWYDKFKSDCFPSDSISVRGTQQRPPKYYDYLLELEEQGALEPIKAKRIEEALKHKSDQTPERLATREQVKIANTKNLKRKLI